jgi:hypothetical protein
VALRGGPRARPDDPLRARYRRIPAPLDGVVGAVTQYYRLERADRDVVEKVLMNLWGVEPSDDDGTTWVAATAEWLVPTTAAGKIGPTGKRFALDRPELRWLVIRRTLERIGTIGRSCCGWTISTSPPLDLREPDAAAQGERRGWAC